MPDSPIRHELPHRTEPAGRMTVLVQWLQHLTKSTVQQASYAIQFYMTSSLREPVAPVVGRPYAEALQG